VAKYIGEGVCIEACPGSGQPKELSEILLFDASSRIAYASYIFGGDCRYIYTRKNH